MVLALTCCGCRCYIEGYEWVEFRICILPSLRGEGREYSDLIPNLHSYLLGCFPIMQRLGSKETTFPKLPLQLAF